MNKKNNTNKAKRFTSLLIAILMLVESLIPSFSYALSGGPSQPEVEGFTPIGTTDMVDLFTGNFNYNIPLMDVDGYPINMGYQSGVSMDQEASWVGLGWNLNPGSVNRSMRGVPDDFKGDEIVKNTYIKPSWTIGMNGKMNTKAFGFKFIKASIGLNLELFYNNYKGFGASFAPDWDINLSKDSETEVSKDDYDKQEKDKKAQKENKERKKYTASDILKNTYTGMYQSVRGMFTIPGAGLVHTSKNIQQNGAKYTETTTKSMNLGQAAGAVSQVSSYFPNSVGYMPKLSNNMQTQNYSFDMNFGGSIAGIFVNPSLKVFVNWEGTDGQTFKKKAYGARYYDNNNSANSDILLDFNREKDGEYSKDKPLLPIPVSTYDIYSISGHGAGGMFRNMRNGITIFHDDVSTSKSTGNLGQIELGVGLDQHVEGEYANKYGSVINGKWSNKFTDAVDNVDFLNASTTKNYEPNYFKITGEKNAINTNLLFNKNIGIPYRPKISKEHLFKIEAKEAIESDNNGELPLEQNFGGNLYDVNRAIKNQYISTLTYDENNAFQEQSFTIGKLIKSPNYIDQSLALPFNLAGPNNEKYHARAGETPLINSPRKPHHIGEITLNQTNGSRYIYGIAAYNNEQTEYTINIGKVTTTSIPDEPYAQVLNTNTNIVDLTKTINIYRFLQKGNITDSKADGYYNSIRTPGFAHSYLLTSILQPDYVDLAPKGTGPEDLGNYTKFNYVRTSSAYMWRTPSVVNKATFMEGLKSQSHDNKASFVEGTKELWYLQTIESKNHVAVFVIEPRDDAKEVPFATTPSVTVGTNGYSFCLKRIVLYTRAEYEKNSGPTQNPLQTATPIKTVWFNYDYSLCKRLHNTSGTKTETEDNTGKLTLKEVYFTFGNSTKKVNAYKFNYSSKNPEYNQSNIDRWGNYKSDPLLGEPNNIDFPYVKQDKAEADQNASAWTLNQIKLPSGAIINVHYEADDYAYVQNKRAAQMIKLEAVGSSSNFPASDKNKLYENGFGTVDNSNFLFFAIPPAYRGSQAEREFYMKQCMEGISQISFKTLMGIRGNNDKEWVNGYAEVLRSNLASDNQHFYVEIKVEDLESRASFKEIHPFTKAGFNFAKSNLPFVVNPNSFGDMDEANSSVEDYAYKILGVGNIVEMVFGVNDRLMKNGFCKLIDLNQSYCRLNEPFKKKLGGGVRVKKITIDDAWATISEVVGTSQEFGQEFDYTTEELNGATTRTISSGVAAYEPGAGSEENPFRLPITYTKGAFWEVTQEEMIEGPVGESFFPSPSVGYSKVTVTNLSRVNPNDNTKTALNHGVGKTINQFYTTKDFPILVNNTIITDNRYWVPMIDLFVYRTQFESKYVSQGFSIQCNDMDGKQKSVEVFKQQGPNEKTPKLLTGTYYKYRTNKANLNQLDNNNITVINDQGQISQKTLGIESEMYADTRQRISESSTDVMEMNFEIITIFWGIPIIPIVPKFEETEDEFYSATLNRVSTAYGIVEEVRVIQDGSEITTKNVAYDALTGDALITNTTNEFKKDIYNTTYPAHWMYDNMGPGYKNSGIGFTGVSYSTGNIVLPSGLVAASYLCHGDEVLLTANATNLLAIINKEGANFKLYNAQDGTEIPTTGSNFDMKIIRSGRKNLQSNPIFSATTLVKPFNTGQTQLEINQSKNIIDAKATTYQLDKTKYMSIKENEVPIINSVGGVASFGNVNQMIEAINYLLPSMGLDVNGSQWGSPYSSNNSPINYCYHYTIPNAFTTNNNPYSTSFLNKILSVNLMPPVIRIVKQANPYQTTTNELRERTFFEIEIATQGAVTYSNSEVKNCRLYFALPIEYSSLQTTFHQNNTLYGISINKNTEVNRSPSGGYCNIFKTYEGNIVFRSKHFPYTKTNIPINRVTSGFSNDGIIVILDFSNCAPPSIEATLTNSNYNQNNDQELVIKNVIVKPETSLLYKGQRNTNTTTFANTKGIYSDFTPFFDINSKSIINYTLPSSKWKVAETATLFDPYNGAEAESKDALERYRSMLYLKDQFVINHQTMNNNGNHYGVTHKPQLYIENAKQSEATAFNFETEQELRTLSSADELFSQTDKHYFEKVNEPTSLSNTAALSGQGELKPAGHTGNGALILKEGKEVSAKFYAIDNYPAGSEIGLMPYYPKIGKKQVITGWVKMDQLFYQTTAIPALCKIEILNRWRNTIGSPITIIPTGPIIDGWQRFSGEFLLENAPQGDANSNPYLFRVTLKNTSTTTSTIYFDDVRIQPVDANIKNYIYDDQHRVKAILDENNYATFYDYNQKGELVSVRRETEKGIVTIQENRKNNSNINAIGQ